MTFLLLASLVACEEVASVPRRRTVPALRVNNGTNPGNELVICDWSNWYCRKGQTCCPQTICEVRVWSCAPDPAATCAFEGYDAWCGQAHPVSCGGGDHCCTLENECIAGVCQPLRDSGYGPVFSTVSVVNTSYHWFPAQNTAFNRAYERGLHDTILPRAAASLRRMRPECEIQQCWVIGYPANLDSCTQPQESGCQGTNTSLEIPGPINITAQIVSMDPAQPQSITWCNDDPRQTREQTFSYSQTHENRYWIGITNSVSVEIGRTAEVGATFNVVTADSSLSLKVKVDLSQPNIQIITKTDQYSSTEKVFVGPRTRVHSRCWINVGRLKAPWTANVAIKGYVVWACSAVDPYQYYYLLPTSDFWQIDTLREHFRQAGLSDEQLDEIWTTQSHGTFEARQGFDVQCSTQVVSLHAGEMCEDSNSVTGMTTYGEENERACDPILTRVLCKKVAWVRRLKFRSLANRRLPRGCFKGGGILYWNAIGTTVMSPASSQSRVCRQGDCEWETWSTWGKCSVTCGNGTQHRLRSVRVQRHFGGLECAGDATEQIECVASQCPEYMPLPINAEVFASSQYSDRFDIQHIRTRGGLLNAWWSPLAHSAFIRISFSPETSTSSLRLVQLTPPVLHPDYQNITARSEDQDAVVSSVDGYVQVDFHHAVSNQSIWIHFTSGNRTYFAVEYVSFLAAVGA